MLYVVFTSISLFRVNVTYLLQRCSYFSDNHEIVINLNAIFFLENHITE